MSARSAVLLLLALLAACSRDAGEMRLAGVVQADTVTISAPESAQLVDFPIEEGSEIEKGEVLAVLESPQIADQLAYQDDEIAFLRRQIGAAAAVREVELERAAQRVTDAQARLAHASREQSRAQKTVDAHTRNPPEVRRRVEAGRLVESPDNLGRLRAEWADARLGLFGLQAVAAEQALHEAEFGRQVTAAVGSAQPRTASLVKDLRQATRTRQELERRAEALTLSAPFRAVLASKVRSPGETVHRGDPVAILYDPENLWVSVAVEESFVADLELGRPVEVELPGGGSITASISNISPAASFATQRDVDRTRRDIRGFRVKLSLPPGAPARPGMTSYVRLRQ